MYLHILFHLFKLDFFKSALASSKQYICLQMYVYVWLCIDTNRGVKRWLHVTPSHSSTTPSSLFINILYKRKQLSDERFCSFDSVVVCLHCLSFLQSNFLNECSLTTLALMCPSKRSLDSQVGLVQIGGA